MGVHGGLSICQTGTKGPRMIPGCLDPNTCILESFYNSPPCPPRIFSDILKGIWKAYETEKEWGRGPWSSSSLRSGVEVAPRHGTPCGSPPHPTPPLSTTGSRLNQINQGTVQKFKNSRGCSKLKGIKIVKIYLGHSSVVFSTSIEYSYHDCLKAALLAI